MFRVMVVCLVLACSSTVDAQLLRRNQGQVCQPVRHSTHSVSHDAHVNNDADALLLIDQQQQIDLLAEIVLSQQGQTVTVQNNFNGFPENLGTTLYGYQAYPQASPFAAPQTYNPYQVDPGSMMREAQRMADRVGDLHLQAVTSYERLGTLALTTGSQADTIRAQTEQLRAQAELIRAATPPAPIPPSQFVAPLTAPYSQRLEQRSSATTQSICITPDGNGGLRITMDDGRGNVMPNTQLPPVPQQVSNAVGILEAHCAKCHTGPQSKGDFEMWIEPGRFHEEMLTTHLERIITRTSNGSMPPEPLPKLSDREIAELTVLLPR